MEVIRIHKVITDDRIAEIKQFMGKKVEIIILSEDNQEEIQTQKENFLSNYRGSCPDIIDGMDFQNTVRQEWER